MQKRIKEENEKKLEEIKKSEDTLQIREKNAEKKTSELIESFEQERKEYYKLF